jgi:hypothetical protein
LLSFLDFDLDKEIYKNPVMMDTCTVLDTELEQMDAKKSIENGKKLKKG